MNTSSQPRSQRSLLWPNPSKLIVYMLGTVCFGLVIMTVVTTLDPHNAITPNFSLATEHTVGTWWSSMQLLFAALLFFTAKYQNHHHTVTRRIRLYSRKSECGRNLVQPCTIWCGRIRYVWLLHMPMAATSRDTQVRHFPRAWLCVFC